MLRKRMGKRKKRVLKEAKVMLTYNEILMVVAMMIALGVIVLYLTILLRSIERRLNEITSTITNLSSYLDLPRNNRSTRKNKPTIVKTARKL